MRLFDQDFPGHYLRLIRRVTLSVIALVPPSEGIHATLATTGMSRVAVGPDAVQTIGVRRPPESVALSAALNATGVFTFEPPTGMRDPFEGLGVDTTWQFDLPKAANLFDFSTIADVLVTIDYTALDSPDYRVQVLRELDQTREGQRGFSLRQEFSDAWWDLNNPGQIDTPMQVSFTTRRTDFPPNLDQITIDHIAVSLICDSPTARAAVHRHLAPHRGRNHRPPGRSRATSRPRRQHPPRQRRPLALHHRQVTHRPLGTRSPRH